MRSIKRFLVLCALAALTASTASAQTDFKALDIKPVVMLLVDTSGSMERMPKSSALPNCASTDNTLKKNRWAVTIEALTGTFDTFNCVEQDRSTYTKADYDYGYHLAHYEFVNPNNVRSPQTADDGILDTFKNRAKFGVMTFDGVGTLLGGDPLLDSASWAAAESDANGIFGVNGMYSYGSAKELVFPGCQTTYYVNSGARRENSASENIPGALISVGASDALADILTVNQKAQNSLLAVRPFGGTPTAAMLDDLDYWLNNSVDVKRRTSTSTPGDDFYTCRPRYAVLVTDGAPDQMFRDDRYNCDDTNATACAAAPGGRCRCPYDLETQIVEKKLIGRDKFWKLFVVAFDVDLAAQQQLDAIAAAGLTEKAYSASNAAALKKALDDLMTEVAVTTATRTTPVTVSSGSAFLAGGKQYEIRTGFKKGETADLPYQGILERQRFECTFPPGKDPVVSPAEITQSEGDLFQAQLVDQKPQNRKIVTVPGISSTDARGTLIAGNNLLTDLSRTPGGSGQSLVTTDVDEVRTFPDLLEPEAFGVTTSAEVDRITDFLTGKSRDQTMLSDIVHSTPAVLPALDLRSPNAYVNAFRRSLYKAPNTYRRDRVPLVTSSGYSEQYGRPSVVFVGTNDGVLHAFNLDTWRGDAGERAAGYEFWGFVPPALFSKLKSAATPNHEDMFDGPPIVRDMILRQDRATPSGIPEMATILLAPVRGAPAYIALDVTLPDREPIFLWQITHERMGNTIAAPALAQVDVLVRGNLQRRGVAILPGGEGQTVDATQGPLWVDDDWRKEDQKPGNPNARQRGRNWADFKGRLLTVVDIATGAVLAEFTNFPAPITGSVTIENIRADTTEHAYFTDADGVLWRLDMTSTDATKWQVVPIWDVFAGQTFNDGAPSSNIPIISRDQAGDLVILLGTGSLDATSDANAKNFVVSLKESNRRLEGETFKADLSANWVLPLAPGELVTGQLSLLDSVVYFGSFDVASTAGIDKCSGGESRLWGVDYLQVDADNLPTGRLRDNSNALVRYLDPTANDGDTSNDGSLVLGVSVTRTPICVQGTIENNAVTGARFVQQGSSGGGTFMVRGVISGTSANSSTGGSIGEFARTINVQQSTRQVSSAGSIE